MCPNRIKSDLDMNWAGSEGGGGGQNVQRQHNVLSSRADILRTFKK